ncbi:hypothetical protein EDB81DRAFT_767220 [Dactylonectria macrodidyma]|uniref:Uncharacterized protein n=1 Tax=Dactylonectria macrodidyma TaxID=307937 RepID=A0A9P9IEY3_9HYPO|nr:hypothetical protein EDB81DRAFT_767220 [Dactylonectria macrodidyma]
MSSLPPASVSSSGKLPVPHFDFKHAAYDWVEENLPDLAAKATRVWLGWYPSNMAFNPMMKFVPLTGSWKLVQRLSVRLQSSLPTISKCRMWRQLWESDSGRRGAYVDVSDKTIEKIWGAAGLEIAAQLRWSEEFPDWNQLEPGRVITLQELGVEGKVRDFKQALESVRDSLI